MKRKLISLFSLILTLILLGSAFASCGAAPAPGGEDLGGNNAPGADNDHSGGNGYQPGANNSAGGDGFSGNGAPSGGTNPDGALPPDLEFGSSDENVTNPNPEEPAYPTFPENQFVLTAENNISTFSADVDTASYTYFRKLVQAGYTFRELRYSGGNFRIEEFINYFEYECTMPNDGELFGVKTSIRPTPWNSETHLLSVTLKAADAEPGEGNNLVFLIDVSGSMQSADKLPLLKKSFAYLTDNLTERDTVSIVTYSGKEEVVLKNCSGAKKETILAAINSLVASGSTHGEAGLRRAYEIATECRIEGGNNRIIMASDGDLNVGISSEEELTAYIAGERDKGIYLSVLGFGTGNYRDANMEALADNGNGVYYYIDGEREAERIFATDLLSTLYTVANDVKLQLTFDPTAIESYRLIGYENRILNNEDFTDDKKDGGEVGSGHTVTVCYEIKVKENLMDPAVLRENLITLAINWKKPGETVSVAPKIYTLGDADFVSTPDADTAFRECVIQLCMLLRGSQYLPEGASLEGILEALMAMDLSASPERAEFRDLIKTLVGRQLSAAE